MCANSILMNIFYFNIFTVIQIKIKNFVAVFLVLPMTCYLFCVKETFSAISNVISVRKSSAVVTSMSCSGRFKNNISISLVKYFYFETFLCFFACCFEVLEVSRSEVVNLGYIY